MRTIRFRGKRLYDGEWVYGYPLMVDTEKFKSANIVTFNRVYPDTLAKVTTAVDFNTLGQFTGLHDKNGKEIYEGDIIRHKDMVKAYHVIYDGHQFCPNDGFRTLCYPKHWEVVGNIHDNPELLKEKS